MGNQLIDAAPLGGPKVAAVATLVSCCPVTPFLFTSYELPPEVEPAAAAMHACPSSCKHQLWQVGGVGALAAALARRRGGRGSLVSLLTPLLRMCGLGRT